MSLTCLRNSSGVLLTYSLSVIYILFCQLNEEHLNGVKCLKVLILSVELYINSEKVVK